MVSSFSVKEMFSSNVSLRCPASLVYKVNQYFTSDVRSFSHSHKSVEIQSRLR